MMHLVTGYAINASQMRSQASVPVNSPLFCPMIAPRKGRADLSAEHAHHLPAETIHATSSGFTFAWTSNFLVDATACRNLQGFAPPTGMIITVGYPEMKTLITSSGHTG
jgi:hypothetical protein